VFIQFAIFLLVGALLWSFYDGQSPEDMGLSNPDDLFASYIINELPAGLSGILIAGILAAAMSTISSSLNSLSTSTIADLYERFTKKKIPDTVLLKQAKLGTLVWAVVFVVFASMFTSSDTPVVELGLSIASYTYGALLGAFFLGMLVKKARQLDALIAFVCTIAVSAVFVLGVEFTVDGEALPLAFPWYVPIGVVVTLVVGGLLSLRHRGPDPRTVEPAKEEEPV